MPDSTLLKILATSAATFVLGLLTKILTDQSSAEKELRQLIAELWDIQRHCNENAKVLDHIDLSKGIPSNMYFERMKIPESSILFSAETFRRIQVDYAQLLYRVRLIVRNINIELAELIHYAETSDCSREILEQHILFSKQKAEWINKKIDLWNNKLNERVNTSLERDTQWDEDVSKPRPKHIIYDRSFPDKLTVTEIRVINPAEILTNAAESIELENRSLN